jgi:hypothetical protein
MSIFKDNSWLELATAALAGKAPKRSGPDWLQTVAEDLARIVGATETPGPGKAPSGEPYRITVTPAPPPPPKSPAAPYRPPTSPAAPFPTAPKPQSAYAAMVEASKAVPVEYLSKAGCPAGCEPTPKQVKEAALSYFSDDTSRQKVAEKVLAAAFRVEPRPRPIEELRQERDVLQAKVAHLEKGVKA